MNHCEIGDCRTILPRWIAEGVKVQMCDGRFKKGERRSKATEFQLWQHWREHKQHWDADWLTREYVSNGRSAGDIAKQNGCTENNILYWLGKHGIPTRDMVQIRKAKYWGLLGAANPMFGRTGKANPHYVDGSSPERQRLYSRVNGREFIKAVYKRDGYQCRRCGAGKTTPRSLHAHHVKPWAGNEALRFDESNAVTLCRKCHSWVHSKANANGEFIGT